MLQKAEDAKVTTASKHHLTNGASALNITDEDKNFIFFLKAVIHYRYKENVGDLTKLWCKKTGRALHL